LTVMDIISGNRPRRMEIEGIHLACKNIPDRQAQFEDCEAKLIVIDEPFKIRELEEDFIEQRFMKVPSANEAGLEIFVKTIVTEDPEDPRSSSLGWGLSIGVVVPLIVIIVIVTLILWFKRFRGKSQSRSSSKDSHMEAGSGGSEHCNADPYGSLANHSVSQPAFECRQIELNREPANDGHEDQNHFNVHQSAVVKSNDSDVDDIEMTTVVANTVNSITDRYVQAGESQSADLRTKEDANLESGVTGGR